jgi:hypothetical protein
MKGETMQTELQQFSAQWKHESNETLGLMRALPPDEYDFRPDPGGRSLGELAWHLAEVDAYVSTGIDRGEFKFDVKPPNIERPRSLRAFPSAFRVVPEDAIARIARLDREDLRREIMTPFITAVN